MRPETQIGKATRPGETGREKRSRSGALRIALLSPYHGGSHRSWADGLLRHSRHEIHLWSLPARFWKWRMHGAAVTLARRFLRQASEFDLILATDMLDLSTFLALTRSRTAHLPALLYMHENQLTYPLPEDPTQGPMRRQRGERDHHYGFVNYASMLAAHRVLFNSHYHRDSFFNELPRFLKHFPDFKEVASVEQIRRQSTVLPVGLRLPQQVAQREPRRESPPLVIWNQRWEYDKNPREFFAALEQIRRRKIPFRLALCGENFRRRPEEFERAREIFQESLIHQGYATEQRYFELLQQADVTVSTARHEFFGISILQAAACGVLPLLPRRLSYPELIPVPSQAVCLYRDFEDLVDRLAHALTHPRWTAEQAQALAPAARRYHWPRVITDYDALLAAAVEETGSSSPTCDQER